MNRKAIHVLLIDDDEDDFILTRDLLASVPERQYEVKWARDLAHAVPEIRSGNHDVYLLDYLLGERSGLTLLKEELDAGRKAPVIMLTGKGTREVDMEAMHAGASAYLQKGDLDAAELDRVIRYGLERHAGAGGGTAQQPRPNRTICFIGAKGGVGTTTVAANVAAALAKRGRHALAVDFRPHYGTCAGRLAIRTDKDLSDLLRADNAQIDAEALREVAALHACGLHLVAAPQAVEGFGSLDGEKARAIVAAASNSTDFLILDLPSAPSDANKESMRAADFVALVVERNPSCLNAGKRSLELFDGWGFESPVGIVVVDRTEMPDAVPLSEIRFALQKEIYGVIPPDPDLCARRESQPPVVEEPDSELAKALDSLAERLSADPIKALPV